MNPPAAALYLAAVGVSLFAVAAASSRWARHDALDRALIGVVTAFSVAGGTALILGMVELLSAGIYLGVILMAGIASGVWLVRAGAVPKRVPAAWSIGGLLALASGAVLAVLAFVPTIRGLAPGHHDTRYYHITNLVHWYRTHSMWELPLQNLGFFTNTHPGNAELASIWMIFATGGDHLIYASNIVFGLLAVIACAHIARSLDARPDIGALAAIAVMSTPLVFATQAHGLATDLPATAMLVAGVAALLRARAERDRRWIAVAGLALGFALGAKYTVILLVPVVVLAAVVFIRPRRDALWLAPGIVLLGAPWFIRNWVATGNPVFPQRVGLFGRDIFEGANSPLLELKTTMLDHLVAGHGRQVRQWLDLAADFWGPAILIAIVGIAGLIIRGRRSPERVAIAALGVVAGLVYLVTPYTGAGEGGLRFLMGSNLRYSITAGVIGAAVAAAVLPTRVTNVLVVAAGAFNVSWMLRGYDFRTDLDLSPLITVVAVLVALGACVLVGIYGARKLDLGLPLVAATTAAFCLVAAIGVARIDNATEVTSLERVLAAQRGKDITVLGVDEMRSVYGRTLQANVTGVSGSGHAGEQPPGRVGLAAAVASTDSDVLVVQDGTVAVPEGWTPPASEWTKTASTTGGDVYVRKPDAPAPSPPPAPAPATPPAPTAPAATAPPVPAP